MSDDFPKKYLRRAQSGRKANKKFLNGLKKLPDRNVDEMFHEAHEHIFAQTDCLTCANCCKTTSPIFTNRDVERISKYRGVRPADFVENYLRIDEDGDYVLKSSPCVFLNSDNTCQVYDVRPKACREYPHTDRRKMTAILDLTYRNTLVCPAVERIVNKIRIFLQERP